MLDLIGKRLGQYEILEEIGRGGMAVVYRAYQPYLNRYVAIKVLRPHLSDDRGFIDRFQREALAASKLEHDNIIRIYDIGQEGDLHYLVMSYVDGPSLAAKLAKEGALDLSTALTIVREVGAALDYAHGQGVVHRDVKPSNILLTSKGKAILSDFGIARAASDSRLTQTGAVVGTPAYMSPEQAEGHAVDGRADLYSLGVVLYEMLTGRAPFQADTTAAVLYKQVHTPPPSLSALNPALPKAVERVVLRALQKDKNKRFQHASEMVLALTQAMARQTRHKSPVPVPAVLAVAVLMIAVTGVWLSSSRPPTPGSTPVPSATAVAIVTPASLAQTAGMATSTRITRTTSPAKGTPSATPTPDQTSATEQAAATAQAVATAAAQTEQTATARLQGTATAQAQGTAAAVATETESPGHVPAPTGRILFASGDAKGIWLCVADVQTGNIRKLADLGNFSAGGNARTNAPQYAWSPDGKRIAYVYGPYQSFDELYLINDQGSGKVGLPSKNGTSALAWSPDGRQLLYVGFDFGEGDQIFSVDPDHGTRRVLRPNSRGEQYRAISWSPDGTQLAIISNLDTLGNHRLWVMGADGSNPRLLTPGDGDYQASAWSPDGKLLAFSSNRDGNYEIYTIEPNGANLRRLTWSPNSDFAPSWSPDGYWIAFASDREGIMSVYITDRQGGGIRRVVTQHGTTPVWGK
jgi:serine/threonine protein kinase